MDEQRQTRRKRSPWRKKPVRRLARVAVTCEKIPTSSMLLARSAQETARISARPDAARSGTRCEPVHPLRTPCFLPCHPGRRLTGLRIRSFRCTPKASGVAHRGSGVCIDAQRWIADHRVVAVAVNRAVRLPGRGRPPEPLPAASATASSCAIDRSSIKATERAEPNRCRSPVDGVLQLFPFHGPSRAH